MRNTKARERPKSRAKRARAGGSFAPISDTKITLSMPSTISMAVSVPSASQPEGVKTQPKSIDAHAAHTRAARRRGCRARAAPSMQRHATGAPPHDASPLPRSPDRRRRGRVRRTSRPTSSWSVPGAVGLSLGIALARAGITVVLVGDVDARPTGRTVALLEGSVQFLARLGVWEQLRPLAEPLRVMRLVDDTGSLFRGPPLDFDAREIGRDCFGYNIQNHLLVAALAEAARAVPGLTLRPGRLDAFAFGPDRRLGDGAGRPRPCRDRCWWRPTGGARGPQGRRHRRPRGALSAGRHHDDAAPRPAAPQRVDRVPHPRRALHAGAPARAARRRRTAPASCGAWRRTTPSAAPATRPSAWRATSSARAACCSAACAWSARSAASPSAASPRTGSSRRAWRWPARPPTPWRRSARRGSTSACATRPPWPTSCRTRGAGARTSAARRCSTATPAPGAATSRRAPSASTGSTVPSSTTGCRPTCCAARACWPWAASARCAASPCGRG